MKNEQTPIGIEPDRVPVAGEESTVDRTTLLRNALSIACGTEIANLALKQLQIMGKAEIDRAITDLNIDKAAGLKTISSKKVFFKSEGYERLRIQTINAARVGFRQQEDLATSRARERALDILSGIYGRIMDNWQIAVDITDPVIMVRAVSCLRASFSQIGDDGKPLKGVDRAKLKKLLDDSGISNNVQVLSQEEIEKRRLQGNARQKAERLGLAPEQYFANLSSANRAYDTLTILGPFYGKDIIGSSPTFRVSAEPVVLGQSDKDRMEQVGNDILVLGQALSKIPLPYSTAFGTDMSFFVPPTWRVDAILDTQGKMQINEIQIADGADALMIAEQIAYGLQTVETSTAFYFARSLRNTCDITEGELLRIAWIRESLQSPYVPNTRRLADFVSKVSQGLLQIEIVERSRLGQTDWGRYGGVVNSSYATPGEIFTSGLSPAKLISGGEYTALGSKAIFALLNDDSLAPFWEKEVGTDALRRLKTSFIPSWFIKPDDIPKARSAGMVVKIYQSPQQVSLQDSGNGVAGPWSDDTQWTRIQRYDALGCQFIAQPFIKPQRISLLIRASGGNDLERLTGYNRICIKYVAENPNLPRSQVALTAAEATIGRNVKPSGRDCCFTAIDFR